MVEYHIDNFATNLPELESNKSHILDMVNLEVERFKLTLERGRRAVKRAIESGGIDQDRLLELYDSQGLPPSVVSDFASEQGYQVEVPDGFLAMVADRHQGDVKVSKKPTFLIDVEPTRLDFYEDMEKRSFTSKVLFSEDGRVVLENTLFYPEGGGQLSDIGTIKWEDKETKVVDVKKIGDVVVHHVKIIPAIGTIISGELDDFHRTNLSRHHTATHLIGAAARKILGSHVWQAGASKYEDRARLDITHHRRLTRDVIELIESEVNALILANHPITTKFYAREEADKKYGNTLYQGGAPKYKEVRVVEIPNIDAQACAGTHVTSTLKVEAVKVLRTERVQDGVERIEFSAGPSAVEASQKERALLEKTADHLGVPIDQAPNAAQKFVKEWKELRNKVSSLEKELASFKSSSLESENIGKN